MKQDQQKLQVRENANDAAARSAAALASEPWVFWALMGRWGFIAAAVLYWVGVISVSPLDFAEWLWSLASGTRVAEVEPSQFLSGPLTFIHRFVGGVSWAALVLPWVGYVRYRVGIIEAGSKEAYHQRRREEAERAAQPAPVGVLVGMSIAKGGFFSSSETLVETSEGFFRVSGLVGTVKKGEPVFKQCGQLLIGDEGAQRRYTVIS
ncbi:hypothetical protein IB232_21585 [Pseudomonas sp. PDM15]|uniref:hypothetical protein n=1 Tax=Pseudomonas sp. PDM15 TaxID=2769303 RepID=UPI00177AA785|nr:hypothetical protein [Pseudomonas sp. PDM15]MBD9427932.1 hypothetical protein [Pseudomonas sp. PDM15]